MLSDSVSGQLSNDAAALSSDDDDSKSDASSVSRGSYDPSHPSNSALADIPTSAGEHYDFMLRVL
jgi:hypothetical protein